MEGGLSSDDLRGLAVDGYFGKVVERDMDGLMDNLASNAIMVIPPLGISFDGKPAVHRHFVEFLDSYSGISIDEFESTADPENGTVAVRFHIQLTSAADGTQTSLRNCNFFHCTVAGQIEKIVIYMSALPTEGFEAGARKFGEV